MTGSVKHHLPTLNLAKLQDNGQLEASMDDLIKDDLLSSPKGLNLTHDAVISQYPQKVMGLYDFQVVAGSPTAVPIADTDVLNSPERRIEVDGGPHAHV